MEPDFKLPKIGRECYTVCVAHPYIMVTKGGEPMLSTFLTYVVLPVVADVLTHIICKWLDGKK
jgi:hypothetical protein